MKKYDEKLKKSDDKQIEEVNLKLNERTIEINIIKNAIEKKTLKKSKQA